MFTGKMRRSVQNILLKDEDSTDGWLHWDTISIRVGRVFPWSIASAVYPRCDQCTEAKQTTSLDLKTSIIKSDINDHDAKLCVYLLKMEAFID